MSELIKMKRPTDTREMTSEERVLFECLKLMVDGIAQTFGSRCEVVIHDLRDLHKLDHSIVKIANGHVTGRTVGGPISDRGLKYFQNGIKEDLLINPSVGKDGSPLKSTSIIFRDDKRKPIAALGINFDVTDILNFNADILNFNAAIQDIFTTSEETQQDEPIETFESDMVSMLNDIVDNMLRKAGRAVPSMQKKDRIEIIRRLEERGFFLIKGAVKLIAAKLNVSKYTVYDYLEQVRSENQGSNLLG